MNDNEAKKAFLRRYQDSLKAEKGIEDEIEALRANAMIHSQNMDGMPRGSAQSDLSTYAAQLDKMLTDLHAEIERKSQIRREIINAIEALPNESEKMILRFRYINGWNWERIAVETFYTYRHVTRIHGNALSHLKLPE